MQTALGDTIALRSVNVVGGIVRLETRHGRSIRLEGDLLRALIDEGSWSWC